MRGRTGPAPPQQPAPVGPALPRRPDPTGTHPVRGPESTSRHPPHHPPQQRPRRTRQRQARYCNPLMAVSWPHASERVLTCCTGALTRDSRLMTCSGGPLQSPASLSRGELTRSSCESRARAVRPSPGCPMTTDTYMRPFSRARASAGQDATARRAWPSNSSVSSPGFTIG